jgi:hypothetical protein
MLSLISGATIRDAAIMFGLGIVVGFTFAASDAYVLSKIENAVGIPAGVF